MIRRSIAIAVALALLAIGADTVTTFAWPSRPVKHPGMHCAKWGHPFVGREGKLVFWCREWAPGKAPARKHPKGFRRHCLHFNHVPRGQHRHCVEWSK